MRRLSKFEILQSLQAQQSKDKSFFKIYPEVITPYKIRHYRNIPGKTPQDKAIYIFSKINWKEKWIAKALKISIRTVRRLRKKQIK